MDDIYNKEEIAQKLDARTDLNDTEKEALKANIFEMVNRLTKHTITHDDHKDLANKAWHLCCASSISLGNIPNAIEVYAKINDDGTRLRDIINDAYKQFLFSTEIDRMLRFITALPTTHLRVSGLYAFLAAFRQKHPEGNIKMFRIHEFVMQEFVPSITETERKQNTLFERLPRKVENFIEDGIKFCVTQILSNKYVEIIFYGRECPENLEKHLASIVKAAYSIENFEKVSKFIFVLPMDSQKLVALIELTKQIREHKGPDDLSTLEERVKALEEPIFDPVLQEIQEWSRTEV